MTQKGIGLGDLQTAFKAWLGNLVRIDSWTLDNPAPLPEQVGGVFYPANTAIGLPVKNVSYEKTEFGLTGAAEIAFLIKYRFHKSMSYEQLPIELIANLLNNVYFEAILAPGGVNPNVRNIRTPDVGLDLVVSHVESENQSDWLITLKLDFYVEFVAAVVDLSDLHTGPGTPVKVYRLDIAVLRGKIGAIQEDYRLDRVIQVENNE